MEDLRIDMRIILKFIFNRQDRLLQADQYKEKWRTLEKTLTKIRVPSNAETCFISREIIRFSRRTVSCSIGLLAASEV